MTTEWIKGLLAGMAFTLLPLLLRLTVALLQRELLDLRHRAHAEAMQRLRAEAERNGASPPRLVRRTIA